MKPEFTYTLTIKRHTDGVATFDASIDGDPSVYELIGLIELHKRDLYRKSKISAHNKRNTFFAPKSVKPHKPEALFPPFPPQQPSNIQ